MHIPRTTNPEGAVHLFTQSAADKGVNEVAIVRNPSYVFPPFEYYMLAPKTRKPLTSLAGVVCDMDGTTTTTETLCLHSLEYMIRRITGRMHSDEWTGLDSQRDFPHIIGNSTTRHVEYLIETYDPAIRFDALGISYIYAALWTLSAGKDPQRQHDVISNLKAVGLASLLDEPLFTCMISKGVWDIETADHCVPLLWEKYRDYSHLTGFTQRVRVAVDIYYQRYHEILSALDEGDSAHVAQSISGDSQKKLIEPMPGVAVYLALIKGHLGEEAALFAETLLTDFTERTGQTFDLDEVRKRLALLGRYFQQNPVCIAVVSSSIYYEMNIVLREVFNVLREQITSWPLEKKHIEDLLNAFASPELYYDAILSASDSSEIRLKPHRDLYSIALHRIGAGPDDFDKVIGFEDSESGIISIRAAGIGMSIALPFADTAGHDFGAASYIMQGGLPEVLIEHLHFLDIETLGNA